MISEILKESESKMRKCIQSLKDTLSKMRTGRAHPSLIEGITIEYYGSEVPLSQVGNISVSDARTLQISPWERSVVPAIEKAIMQSDLGLNPVTAGEVIRVPLPPLTEERRREIVRSLKGEVENAKVAIRNVRRDANNKLKSLEKDKAITADDLRHSEDKIQKATDAMIKDVDALFASKEAEIMTV